MTITHASDCAVHNEPAMPAGPCDCGALPMTPTEGLARECEAAAKETTMREQIVAEIMKLVRKPPERRKPTIDELEKILNSADAPDCHLEPDGTMLMTPETHTTVGDIADAVLKIIVPQLDSAASALREREWRPIESAPKDGTIIDVFLRITGESLDEMNEVVGTEYSGHRISDVWWHDEKQRWHYGTEAEDRHLCDGIDKDGLLKKVTHWQPLPPPPQSSGSTEKENGE